MSEQTLMRGDKVAAWALLAGSCVVAIIPEIQLRGQSLNPFLVSFPWLMAALLLFSHAHSAKSLRWTRGAATSLFIAGLAAPFVGYFINLSLGAR